MYWRLLRRNRDFRLLYAGTLISLGGDWFLTVALLDLVLELTGSATLASVMVLSQTLPVFLITPVAGPLVDKVDRRKLMIVVDLLRIGACLLPLLTRSLATLPFAFAGSILISIGSAYFEPASQAALPNIVSSEELSAANILMGSTWGTMLAVGAGLGGLVTMHFGRNVSFAVDALSFLFSAFLLWRMRGRFSELRAGVEHPSMLESLKETARYARDHPRVLALLSSKGGYGLGAGVVAMLSIFGRDVFHSGASGIGLLYASRGMGALLGPFFVRGLSRSDDGLYGSMAWCVVLFGFGYTMLGLSPFLWVGALGVFLAHLGGGAQWQTSTYGLQREVPDRIRGRVFSVDYGLVTLTMSMSSLGAGVAADHFGPVAATIGTASICILWGLGWGWSTRKLWRAQS